MEHVILTSAGEVMAASAETERRDVLAFLRTEIAKHVIAANEFRDRGAWDSAGRCEAGSHIMFTIAAYIERGDHVGAAERSAAP